MLKLEDRVKELELKVTKMIDLIDKLVTVQGEIIGTSSD